MIVQTPNEARRADVNGRGPDCQALTRMAGCANGARWELTTDGGALVHVCRLHANQAARQGRLEIADCYAPGVAS